MKPLLLWSLLISSALHTICQTNNESYSTQTEASTKAAATTITASVSVTAVTPGLTYDHSTVPGTVYPRLITETPAAVTELHVTNVTTSSVSLSWTNPTGQQSSFRVQWTNGANNWSTTTKETSYTITGLVSGVGYNVTVSAVAADGHTGGEGQTVSLLTRLGKVVLQSMDINTSSISLTWTSPPGLNFEYRVEWNSSKSFKLLQTVKTSAVLLDLIPGTSYTIMITVVVGDNVTGEAYTISTVTKPAVVGNLSVTSVTTWSISLNWAQPEGSATWFTVRWAGEENKTTKTSFVITNLNPGTQYNISVAAVAVAPSNEGGSASTMTFTRPEKPENIMLTSRGTDNLSIRWSLLKGNFQYFRVNVTQADSGSLFYNETKANTVDITGLSPGRIFAIAVSTVAGNFAEASEEHQFATVPTPPGSITSQKTNSSLKLEWATPALMDHTPNVSYYIAYQSIGKEMQNIRTSDNHTELFSLSSGTFYNITLITIGIQNLESTAVHYSTCTWPNPVLNLVASPISTSSLYVQWSYPQGAQTYYTYLVLGPNSSTTVETNSTKIANLDPGTKYRVTVKTIAAAECESLEEETRAYTMPQAVSNLMVADEKATAVRLEWLRQADYKQSYSYLLVAQQAGVVVQNYTTPNETSTFLNLTPGESYVFDVYTVVGGVKSEVKSISSDTKPAPATNVTVRGSTTTLSVSWSAAAGLVGSYAVLLYRDNRLEASHQNLNNRTVNTTFANLTPGVYYCAIVVSKTRSFETNSLEACRATVPNPPGPIFVESLDIHFINYSWPLPDYMDHHQYNFTVSSCKGSSITKNNWFLLDKLQSGSLYNISVSTLGVSNYKSAAVVAKNYTRPYPVHNLTEEQATTNTVTLLWEQLESKPHYSYVVQASSDSIFWSKTCNSTTVTVTGLIPGSRYNFTVISQTADGTRATPVELSSYTQPDSVEPSVSSQGSNSSLLVSWSPPRGRLEHYYVLLNSSFPQDAQKLTVANTSNQHVFGNLSSGRLYSVQLTVHSGPKEASSGFVFNATFPNPPGPLDVLAKTNNSIDVKWQRAPLMTVGSFSYQLSISSRRGGVFVSVASTSHSFLSLLSGTPYNISVLTVGVLGFKSKEVQIFMVNTKPFNVKNLRVSSVGENHTTVGWDHPYEYKESYHYNVTWKSSENVFSSLEIRNTSAISDLVPGSLYHISVTTETFDGTQADSQWISSCTDASPVSGLQCQGPNTEDATLLVSWVRPSGQFSAFQLILNDGETKNFTSSCCSDNVRNLRHYTRYTLTVKTQSCGQASRAVTQECWTGITNPPIFQDYESLVTEKTHNRFSIQIDPRLLNNTNGPVTHVGVLVTNESPGNTSNWRQYLGKTYEEWKESLTPVYLAAVKSISTSRSTEVHHTLHVGDESKWEGYTNGALIPGRTYYYAVVVFTHLSFENNLVNGEKSLVSSTRFSLSVVLHGDPVIGIAVGATLGIFFILFVILLGFIIYWRRISRKEETDIQIHSMRSVAVRMEDYEVYYRKQKADSNCGFAEEFEDLKPVGTDQSKTVASFLENKPKNRYNNVLPYDSSRVKLSIIHGSPYDDYINANYMPGYNSRKEFIAAQGPLPATVKDFWRMIWEKNVRTLVMLTRCNEQGRVKCEQYWDFGTKHFENINVTTVSDLPLEDWSIRDFDIKNVKTAETRSVRQFHFTAWPDHGVPETTELLISFRHLVREHMDQYSRHSPTVVHCSAGVGRTGTFIAIDRLIFQIERENIVDVYGIVHDLRMHRPLMVQTEDQYVFLNQCAMDIIRSRTGTNVDLIYQNTAAMSIYENIELHKGYHRYPDA